MNDKELIKKLYSIAVKQQKVIEKLAQMSPASPMGGSTASWEDVSADVEAKLKQIPEAKGYSVYSAEIAPSDGSLKGKLIYPKGDLNASKVISALKAMLVGKPLRKQDGTSVAVSGDPANVSFIAMT